MNEIINNGRKENQSCSPSTDIKSLVSLIVPAYNEADILERNLTTLCEHMKTLEAQYRWELLIVNDGSTDATGDIADAFAAGRQNVCVLHHMFNFRLGQALRYAFHRCSGDIVVVMDIDLSYSAEHIGRMLAKMKETRAKVVVASPYAKGGKVSNVPWGRRLLSRWANKFICLMASKDYFSDKLTTITGMVRAYDGPFVRRLSLRAMDMDINAEIIHKSKILRARIVEIPAHLDWMSKQKRKSRAKQTKSDRRIIMSIILSFVSGYMFRPFMFFIVPGLILFCLSSYPLAWTVIHTVDQYKRLVNAGLSIDYRLSEAIGAAFKISPHSFYVGGVALMVSIQLLSLGLLAIQKMRYFHELYFLDSTIYRESRDKNDPGKLNSAP